MAHARIVECHGARLYVEEQGTGFPLVLLHGWSLDLRMFDDQVPAFSRRFRVIRLDRRGFGRSSDGEDVTWDAADLAAVLDAVGVERAHVLGMSQGATVALAFTLAHPDRVARLVLHGAPAPRGFGLRWNGPDRWPLEEYRTIAAREGLEAFRRAWLAHPLMHIPPGHDRARRRRDEMVAAYRGGVLLDPRPPSGPVPTPTMDDLERVAAPVLVLTGEDETPYFRIVADALAYAIPGARRAVIPGGGHLINLIEPARYNEAVIAFLEDAAARAGA
jgi:3-oxoadipate enol-lactonase